MALESAKLIRIYHLKPEEFDPRFLDLLGCFPPWLKLTDTNENDTCHQNLVFKDEDEANEKRVAIKTLHDDSKRMNRYVSVEMGCKASCVQLSVQIQMYRHEVKQLGKS